MYLEVTPAYGRDYTSQKQVREAWAAGKDFVIATVGRDMGRMINKQDADAAGVQVMVRYAKLRKVVIV